jgi:hypothetical protein
MQKVGFVLEGNLDALPAAQSLRAGQTVTLQASASGQTQCGTQEGEVLGLVPAGTQLPANAVSGTVRSTKKDPISGLVCQVLVRAMGGASTNHERDPVPQVLLRHFIAAVKHKILAVLADACSNVAGVLR